MMSDVRNANQVCLVMFLSIFLFPFLFLFIGFPKDHSLTWCMPQPPESCDCFSLTTFLCLSFFHSTFRPRCLTFSPLSLLFIVICYYVLIKRQTDLCEFKATPGYTRLILSKRNRAHTKVIPVLGIKCLLIPAVGRWRQE